MEVGYHKGSRGGFIAHYGLFEIPILIFNRPDNGRRNGNGMNSVLNDKLKNVSDVCHET